MHNLKKRLLAGALLGALAGCVAVPARGPYANSVYAAPGYYGPGYYGPGYYGPGWGAYGYPYGYGVVVLGGGHGWHDDGHFHGGPVGARGPAGYAGHPSGFTGHPVAPVNGGHAAAPMAPAGRL